MRAWGADYRVPVPRWSPDGGSLVFGELPGITSELMLVDNFR